MLIPIEDKKIKIQYNFLLLIGIILKFYSYRGKRWYLHYGVNVFNYNIATVLLYLC